jgi:acetolactate synthase I/II/III large subunit
MIRMYGTVEAKLAVHNAGLVVAVGARLDDRAAGRPDGLPPNARVVHVDVDPAAFG